MRPERLADLECAIAQAAAVVGDWWSLLIVRDIASGIYRFDELQSELEISRKVLAERLAALVEHGVLEKVRYQSRPPRYEYRLTAAGLGLLPVLIALQDWGGRWVSGDGTLSATSDRRSVEARRVRQLEGTRVAKLELAASGGAHEDPISGEGWTVLMCFPGAYASGASYPPGWDDIPGAAGCTLEATAFSDRASEFAHRDSRVVGISTQRPDEQSALAKRQRLHFPLLSDQDLQLAAALRLPTFRAGGLDRLKRLTLIIDSERTVRRALYPVTDPAAAADDALAALAKLA